MANPDFQIRGGGGHPDSEIRGTWSKKIIKYKYKGRAQAPWAPLLDPPLYYIAASPQASSALIFGLSVVSWVSLCYLGIIIWIYVCQDD